MSNKVNSDLGAITCDNESLSGYIENINTIWVPTNVEIVSNTDSQGNIVGCIKYPIPEKWGIPVNLNTIKTKLDDLTYVGWKRVSDTNDLISDIQDIGDCNEVKIKDFVLKWGPLWECWRDSSHELVKSNMDLVTTRHEVTVTCEKPEITPEYLEEINRPPVNIPPWGKFENWPEEWINELDQQLALAEKEYEKLTLSEGFDSSIDNQEPNKEYVEVSVLGRQGNNLSFPLWFADDLIESFKKLSTEVNAVLHVISSLIDENVPKTNYRILLGLDINVYDINKLRSLVMELINRKGNSRFYLVWENSDRPTLKINRAFSVLDSIWLLIALVVSGQRYIYRCSLCDKFYFSIRKKSTKKNNYCDICSENGKGAKLSYYRKNNNK